MTPENAEESENCQNIFLRAHPRTPWLKRSSTAGTAIRFAIAFAGSITAVIPAKAGIQFLTSGPKGRKYERCGASRRGVALDSRFRGNDGNAGALDFRFHGNDVNVGTLDFRFHGMTRMYGHWISASTEMMEIRSRSIQKRSDHDGYGEHGGKYFSTTTGVATSPQGAGQPEADLAKRDATTPHRGGNLSGAFPTQAMPVPFFRHSRERGNPVCHRLHRPHHRRHSRESGNPVCHRLHRPHHRRHSRESGNPVPCLQAEGLQIQIQRMRRHAPDGTPWIPAFAGMTRMRAHRIPIFTGMTRMRARRIPIFTGMTRMRGRRIPIFAGMTGMFRHLTSVYAGIAGIFLLLIQKRFNSFQTLPWIPADQGTTGFPLVFRRVRRG